MIVSDGAQWRLCAVWKEGLQQGGTKTFLPLSRPIHNHGWPSAEPSPMAVSSPTPSQQENWISRRFGSKTHIDMSLEEKVSPIPSAADLHEEEGRKCAAEGQTQWDAAKI